jgi:hypothetical protein
MAFPRGCGRRSKEEREVGGEEEEDEEEEEEGEGAWGRTRGVGEAEGGQEG